MFTRALTAILQLLATFGGWLRERQLIKSGEDKQRARDLEESVEIAKRQADAAANSPDTPDELVDRLRDKGGF